MSSAPRNREIRAVDAFLAEDKHLVDGLPEWATSSRKGEMQAIWNIADAHGIERGHLRFRCASRARLFPSVSVIFRDNPIWRVDVVPADECKYNPVWCHALGLPSTVCGNHEHGWPDNRNYVTQDGPWTLPARRPLTPQLRQLTQIIPWFAIQIHLELNSEVHSFNVPPQTDLLPR